jgi:hypothetical protein
MSFRVRASHGSQSGPKVGFPGTLDSGVLGWAGAAERNMGNDLHAWEK